MTGDELAAAVGACGYVCCECQSDSVRLDWTPVLGYVPVVVHWPLPDGTWCPATHGGPAAARSSLDLLELLAAHVAVAEYGEPVWHRRPRLAVA